MGETDRQVNEFTSFKKEGKGISEKKRFPIPGAGS